jgi:hypothetical protein
VKSLGTEGAGAFPHALKHQPNPESKSGSERPRGIVVSGQPELAEMSQASLETNGSALGETFE